MDDQKASDEDIPEAVRELEEAHEVSKDRKNKLLRRAVLVKEMGLSPLTLPRLTPKEQDDLIDAYEVFEEEKKEKIEKNN